MRLVLTIALLAACGGSDEMPDPHAAATCGSSWDPRIQPSIAGKQCEAACAEYSAGSGSGCTTTCAVGGGAPAVCSATIEYGGARGCCIVGCDDVQVGFAECQ